MKASKDHISCSKILQEINDDLEASRNWLELDDYERALRYRIKAETLIEILEVNNCGSIGGFDCIGKLNQQDESKYHDSIHGRYLWLKEKKSIQRSVKAGRR